MAAAPGLLMTSRQADRKSANGNSSSAGRDDAKLITPTSVPPWSDSPARNSHGQHVRGSGHSFQVIRTRQKLSCGSVQVDQPIRERANGPVKQGASFDSAANLIVDLPVKRRL